MPRRLYALFLLTFAPAFAAVDFDREIRPILSDKCFACHGPGSTTRVSDLRFDTEEGAFAKLNSGGFAIVRGKPEESALLQRVSSDDPVLRMPPAYQGHEKLGDGEIAALRRWIEEGAPWSGHWAYAAPQRPALPKTANAAWTRNPIDHFVLSRLEEEGLEPSPEADRAALIRRVSLDLTGLPPTPAEVDAFLADDSPRAYERVVDRMLASPRYGERMAYPWLDAARYADTNGYQSDGVRDMWRWRDWVIDAFNRNMPFDQFTIEQIAGDMLRGATRGQLIASAFNRNHRTNAEGGIVEEEFRVEYVADRAATTATVWLGMTAECARCHDHKFDPLTQKEFYQFFAFFNNTPDRGLVYNFGNEEPFIPAPTPEQEERLAEFEERVARREKEFQALEPDISRQQAAWESKLAPGADWLPQQGLTARYPLDGAMEVRAADCAGEPCEPVYAEGRAGKAAQFDGRRYLDLGGVGRFDFEDPFTFAVWIRPDKPTGAILSREIDAPEEEGYGLYLRDGKLWMHITRRWTDISLRLESARRLPIGEWSHIAVSYDGERKGKGVTLYVNGEEWEKNILFDELTYPYGAREPFKIGAGGGPDNRFHGMIADLAIWDRALTPEEASTLHLTADLASIAAKPAKKRGPAEKAKLRLAFLEQGAPAHIVDARLALADARRERDAYFESIPTVMVMQELEDRRDSFVLERGDYEAHGEKVDPDTPAFLPPLRPEWKKDRLGLARWLVARENPLTARVTVNRFWQQFFGAGLVKTPEDFGVQGDRPEHDGLLDWLAVEFMESGWDMKALVKTIVTSATYRQDSRVSEELRSSDPENRLLARGPRFRLPASTVRDQALAAAGLLTPDLGGPSVKPYQPDGLWEEVSGTRYVRDSGGKLYRRSLYSFWKRTVAPPSMVNFDASDRETCIVTPKRTNTPLQALNLMNDVAFVEASRVMAERMMREGGEAPGERIAYGFKLAAAREPREREARALMGAFEEFRTYFSQNEDDAWAYLGEGESPWDRGLKPVELAAYSSVASLILNLDETVTKE